MCKAETVLRQGCDVPPDGGGEEGAGIGKMLGSDAGHCGQRPGSVEPDRG